MRERLKIGEVARFLGVTTKRVRHYEKVGLLGEPQRLASKLRERIGEGSPSKPPALA